MGSPKIKTIKLGTAKMKVWVVTGVWDYEGSELVGVYSSREKAESITPQDGKYVLTSRGDKYHFDWLEITEMEVL